MLTQLKDSVSVKGHVKMTVCDPSRAPLEHQAIERFLRENPERPGMTVFQMIDRDQKLRGLLQAFHNRAEEEHQEIDNMVVTAGRTLIANSIWQPSIDTRVSHVEVGTGTNAPANGDTALQTAVYRNALASGNNAANIVTLTGYYNLTETSGTFREAGLFINGTGTLGTGTLLSRVAINIAKTTSQTMTIEWTLTIS